MHLPNPNPRACVATEPEVHTLSYPLTPEALTPVARVPKHSSGPADRGRKAMADDPGGLEYASWLQRLGTERTA